MDYSSYYKELKALVHPDSEILDDINSDILIAKAKKDHDEIDRLKAQKIYFKVIDPFLKTLQYIVSMRPLYFDNIDKEISQMQADPTAVKMDPVEIFDFLEKQDNPLDILKVFCSTSDYFSLSNAFSNPNREIAKQEFIALVSDKSKQVDVTKLSYYCASNSFFKEKIWSIEDDQTLDDIVSMSYGDDVFSQLKNIRESHTTFNDDPSYENFDLLYGAYFFFLIGIISHLESKPFSVEKELLIDIFYNEEDPDCIFIYRDWLEFFFHIDIWEKIPEERKQIILQLPLAEEIKKQLDLQEETVFNRELFLADSDPQIGGYHDESFQKEQDNTDKLQANDKVHRLSDDYESPKDLPNIKSVLEEIVLIVEDLPKTKLSDIEIIKWFGDPRQYKYRDLDLFDKSKPSHDELDSYLGLGKELDGLLFCIFVNSLANIGYLENTEENLQRFVFRLTGRTLKDREQMKDSKAVVKLLSSQYDKGSNQTSKALWYIIKSICDTANNGGSRQKIKSKGSVYEKSTKLFAFSSDEAEQNWFTDENN